MTLTELSTLPYYLQAFGIDPCVICGRRTPGKAADYVNVNGGYFEPCIPLCARCNRKRRLAARTKTRSGRQDSRRGQTAQQPFSKRGKNHE